jgi:hypothetical protein
VTVQPGGALDAEGARIVGPLTSTSAIAVRLCNVTLTGPATIGATGGPVVLGDDDGSESCAGSQLVGPVRITAGGGGVEFDGNTVTGPLAIVGNTGLLAPPDTGAVDATGNSVSGPTDIQP